MAKKTKPSKPDKRDAANAIGSVLPKGHQFTRDAIHVAVMPVIAGEDYMHRGDKVKIKFGTTNVVLSDEYNDDDYLGIIDPFLPERTIREGDAIFVFLRPGTITGLRHEWTHLILDCEPASLSEAEIWLHEFAERWRFDYEEMIREAMSKDGCIVARGRDLHSAGELDHGEEERFWECIKSLTGKDKDESVSWSCTC